MPRKYTKIKELEPEVFRMKSEGKTNREIVEHFGVTREQIRELVKRHNRDERNIKQGNPPKTKGRPRCGKELVYILQGSRETIRCLDPACIKSIRRGI